MGSVGDRAWVNLDALGQTRNTGTSIENIIETTWAIAHFIYTNDNEVNFIRHLSRSTEASVIRSFVVGQDSSPADIAKNGSENVNGKGQPKTLDLDPSAPIFTQIIRKTAISISSDGVDYTDSDYDENSFVLQIMIKDHGIRGAFSPYDSLYQESLEGIADTVQRVSQLIAENWAKPLHQMNFLGPKNWLRLTENAPETAVIGPSTMGDILDDWSTKTPSKIAVESWDGDLTYSELHTLARKFAEVLIQTGISPEERVGICMKKSKWSMITFWGLLLAGVTGVPLDIRNPKLRMEALLNRVEARYVIADEWTAMDLEGIDIRILYCDKKTLENRENAVPLVEWPQITPQTVAFILFTSGSTGLPKGVLVEHGPLYGSTVEIARELYLDESSRTFQFASFVSDASMGDIFATMYKGGCINVPSEEQRLGNLQSVLENSRSTHACLTSSVMSQLQPEALTHLRYMIAIGEAISKENTVRWSPYVHMISAYGIAESIIYDSFASPQHLASDYRNIGLAKGPCLWVSNIHDPERLLPVGAVGEILIEGPLLARGYMGDPKKTAERFIPAPAWLKIHRGPRDNHRCYRSGDFGIANADGTVLYLGRADTQVKVRGQRVELGEIAHSLLNAEPRLDQVAVEAINLNSRGNSQALVAFCKRPCDENEKLDSPILPLDEESKALFRVAQSKLLESLPRYMVPSLFIPVTNVPKNTVGKRDRNTLLRWGAGLTEEQVSEYQLRDASTGMAPETSEEKLVQKVWSEVLRAPESSLGASDNFFQAGGDSIKVIELLAAFREHGKIITVSQIFQHPELNEMAKRLETIHNIKLYDVPNAFELVPGNSQEFLKVVQEAANVCNVSADSIEDIYPTTPLQEALIAISAQRADVYTHRLVFRIPDTLDVPRFKKACETLVSEQAIFRTSIVTLPSLGTMQVVLRSAITWYESGTLEEFVQFDKSTPFVYGSMLSRYALLKGRENSTYFVWSGHHAITDGWSRPAMFDELRHIYLHGTARPQVPFNLFIKHCSNLDLEESDDFWREQFPDVVESFPKLPTSSYTPQPESSQSLSFSINRQTKSPITMATVVQAAWALVVSTYANLDEAAFGLTLSGRDAPVPGITRTMGVTITTVPVRVVLDNTNTIMEYLQEIQQYMSHIKQHQHVGLQRIQRLGPEARSAANFQNLLVVQPIDEAKDHEGLVDLGLKLVDREERDTSQYALTVQCTIGSDDGSLQIMAHYDENIIDEKQMESLLHLFKHLVAQLATESDEISLHNLNKMSPHDWALLGEWNGNLYPATEKTLHELFQGQVNQTPDAVALDGFDGQMSYSELDSQSTQLARYLHDKAAVDLESRVILCFKKSKVPIIAMMATLKSGGVCVSINPEHPTPRLVEMIKDAEADVVLCDDTDIDRFQTYATHVIGITSVFIEKLQAGDTDDKLPKVDPTNGSFVVFTSGSTGKPKGSLLEHRSLATDLSAVGQRVGLDAKSRTLQFSAYTFDAHILEIFGTLIQGGCICVISDHERMNDLSEVMNKRQVNFALLTKTVSRLLEPEGLPALKSLILSGEANGRQDYWRWAGCVKLFNGLGPSECCPLVCLTRGPVQKDDDPANIGYSLACNVWITDRRRRPVPIGCVGELTVEGPIVGRGYINRPKESASSFFVDPDWSKDGSGRTRRFYRSGDLAKMNSDGSITFLGRADNQIKIHGQRVELGEIEDQLRRCSPAFTTSAVDTLKVSSRGGATVLVVFCALGGEDKKKSHTEKSGPILALDDTVQNEFRATQSRLIETLPSYMVPSLFIPVTHLPFNASGKLERTTLRDWVSTLDANQLGQYYLLDRTSSRAPETAREKQLQRLWAKVLDIPLNTIHAEDNFFRLGGDSVLSMRLIAEARADGVLVTVAEVFRSPILQDLALSISKSDGKHHVASVETVYEPFSLIKSKINVDECIQQAAKDCQVSPDTIEDIYPCNPTQEALMAVSSHRPKAYTYQIILKLPTSMDIERFKSTWEKLANSQAIFRTRIIYWRGFGSLQVTLRKEITWQIIVNMSLKEYLDQHGSLFVEYGSPLSKFTILQNEDETTFVGTMHHSLYDGSSLKRTYEMLGSIYQDEPLHEEIVPYSNFFQYLSAADEHETDNFWKNQFPTTIKSYPELPFTEYIPQPKKSKTSTIEFAQRAGSSTTLATVVQTAWAILMSNYSDNEDVIFGLMLSGRDVPVDGIADIIGPTIATVPLRVHVDRDETLSDMLDKMQTKIADIRKYQHVGLQRIRRLSLEAAEAVKFQNLLVVHTMGDSEITSPLTDLGLQPDRNEIEEFLDLALTAECTIRPGNMQILLNYDDAIIADKQIDFMLYQLEHIANTLLTEPLSTKLRDVDILPSHDLETILGWNSSMGEPLHTTLHSLFEAQARATPNAVATCGYDTSYTFRELDAAANGLAAHLTSLEVGPEKHVVLCFRKATLPIIAILAVLKSGGVSVSVNIEHPSSRRLEICQDIEACAVLCDADQEQLFSGHVPNVVVVDPNLISALLDQSLPSFNLPNVLPSNAAFIVYTSGSTGKPKGCVLEHHSVSLSMKTYATTFGVKEGTRILQFAAYSFDAHILEIFGTLIHGGCVCVISEEERMNSLISAINDRKATQVLLTPTVAQLIHPNDVPTVDTIVLGAEPLTQKSIELWSSAPRPVRMIQHYAPAETSNLATVNFELDKNKDPANIGPASGCGVWIVEKHNTNHLSLVGCIGEILLEGPVLARGYWKRPEATQNAFIEDPVWSQGQNSHRRFYRTGDMGSFQTDGSVKFIGRADTQVKINGQRVELAEVEYQVGQPLPNGSEVVVEICEIRNTSCMVAFIKLSSFGNKKADSLEVLLDKDLVEFRNVVQVVEETLPKKLPQYMIPSAFIPISFMPISASTKIERKRLREFAQNISSDAWFSSGSSTIKEAPTNSNENNLQLIWSQVLNLERNQIGINENFTSLGGDSITAMQIVSECRKHGIKLQVATILEKKTIKAITPHCVVKGLSEYNTVSTVSDGEPFDLSAVQNLYFEQEGQQSKRFNQSFLFRVQRDVSVTDVQRAFGIIVERHSMLRARFRHSEENERWAQFTVPPSTNDTYRFKLHTIDETTKHGEKINVNAHVEALIQLTLSEIDIVQGPVFSVDFFNVKNEDSMVYMAAHHLVVDLVSWRIIWRDVEDILNNSDAIINLPRTTSFADWVAIQKWDVSQEEMISAAARYLSTLPNSEFEYWGVSEQNNTLAHAVETSFSLSSEDTSLILGRANEAMRTTTLDIVTGILLRSFQQTFSDRGVPTVFVEHHGREASDIAEDVDVSTTVGWFTSLCPVYIPVATATTDEEAVRLTKDTRRSVPRNGQSFFVFNHVAPEGREFTHHMPAEILINYSGIFQQLETDRNVLRPESRVLFHDLEESDPKSRRFAMIDLEIGVSDGAMRFSFNTHKDMAHQDSFKKWVKSFQLMLVESLKQLVLQPPKFTLCDFPRLKLSYEEHEDLLKKSLPLQGFEKPTDLVEDIYPCTAMQEGILLSQQTSSQMYQLQYVWEFKKNSLLNGDLISKLEGAWKLLTSRHSSLRTAIVEYASHQGHFVQVVLKELPGSRLVQSETIVESLSLISDVPESEQDKFWDHVPRLTIYHTRAGTIACGLKLSHALIDGISLDLLMEEFIHLMLGNTLLPASADFGEYVQHEQNAKSEEDVSYWADYLKGAQPCHMPTGKRIEPELEYDYLKLPRDTTAGLGVFCRRLGITPAVVIQGAWAMVLGAFTGQDEVCFGYLASGRDAPLDGIENSIGLYISMQVCRVHLAGTISDLLQGINNGVIKGLQHRNSSLAQIQSILGLKGLSLFNTCLTIRRFLDDPAKMNSFITTLEGAERTEFVIALGASVGSDGAEIGMSYQKNMLSPLLVSGIAGSLQTVIQSLIKSENATVWSIDVIGKDDNDLVNKWNQRQETVDETLHGLVEQQVQANPNKIATSGFDGEYTYSELNTMAKKLAFYLSGRGVGVETRVVLCFAKSTWPVVAMLSVLKSGGVCVSTNPDHPVARLLDIVRDVEATVVLCDEINAARFHGHVPHVVTVNKSTVEQLTLPSDWEQPKVQPSNAAFVVYTSGSTGKPKGCVLEHHSVSKSQLVNAEAMRITPDTRVMQFAAYTFDASICEIFAPWVVGACLCVVSDDERMDDLAGAINARKADWIMLTPTVAQLFSPAAVPTLKTLVFGGEPLSRKALEIWQGHVHLVNYYGPSEVSNSACLNKNVTTDSDPMNIGPASGCNVWIALQNNPHKLAPVGGTGELLIEGSMLGREYVNRAEATAAAFVTDLDWAKGSETHPRRFYRTGDLGRFNADGSITIAGRADTQVKIHGQRVELGEIKHQVATRLSSGSEVSIDVCAVGNDSQKPVLTAFIKLDSFAVGDPESKDLSIFDVKDNQKFQEIVGQLKQLLPGVLPQYMIPAAYIPVCRVPTTPSAKTDKKMLRDFALSITIESAFMQDTDLSKKQPTNEVERQLQKVWSKVLNLPTARIGVDDTFMSVGGDSITAMQVVAHCRKANIKLPVSTILQKKTIAAIAPHCESELHNSPQVTFENATEGTPFNLTPIQKRYFEHESGHGRISYNQSLFLRVKSDVSTDTLKEAFDFIVSRHGMLRAHFLQSQEGTWQQRISTPGENTYRFKSHDLEDLTETSIDEITRNSTATLDIVDGPVFSVDAFRIANQDGMIFVTAHHLVVDIVSWQIILSELEDIIHGGKALDQPTWTFQQWAQLQDTEIKGSKEEVLPVVVPPSSYKFWKVPREENVFRDTLRVSFDIPSRTTDLILNESNNVMSTSPIEILLGPLLLSFRHLFPERNVPSVFIEHHGREGLGDGAVEASQLVGWFTTMYPIHVPLDSETTAAESIRHVKDLRRKVPRNGLPYFSYRHLVEEGAKRYTEHDPVELLVNYSGAFQQFESKTAAVQMENRINTTVSDADPNAHRWAMIDVEIGVSKGVMQVNFLLNKKMAHLDRIYQWIDNYQDLLSRTADELQSLPPMRTLSDFPLLDGTYETLNTILNDELPKLGYQTSENIQDILNTSSFQNFALEGHLNSPPRHWLCYYFELPGDVAITRLQNSCIKLVEHYSILRTIFIRHKEEFLQIVLKSLQPRIDYFESTEDIDTSMERLFHQDLSALPRFGKPFLRFTILRTQKHVRLLMRLSHAQFDGFSRIAFVKSLLSLYNNDTLPSNSLDYSDFMRRMQQSHYQGCDYWRSVLLGAETSEVIKSPVQPKFEDRGVIRVEKTIPPFTKLEGVTSATLFNAACAILVQSLTGSSDITFCRLTSGRAALDASFQELIGPCLNMIPVRVQFSKDRETGTSSVLQQIHKQYIESIPYETTGLDDIIRECTDWPTSMARFPIVTQHLNLDEGSEVRVDDTSKFSVHVWDPVDVDPFPYSLALGAFPNRTGVKISITGNSRYIEKAELEKILVGLCKIIANISEDQNLR